MKLKESLFKEGVNTVINNKLLRKIAVKELDKIIHNTIINDNTLSYHAEKVERYQFSTGLMKQVSHNLDKGYIKPEVTRKMVNVFVGNSFKSSRVDKLTDTQVAYKEKYGD